MKTLFNFIFMLFTSISLLTCDSNEPQTKFNLSLTLEDISCTEAWLQLTTNNIQLPTTINLLKNNSVSQTYILNTKDSLLYIDSLLPNQNYKLQVSSIQNPVSSNELSITTMDTTSHNFPWQTFTFGDAGAGSSTLYDVAIIDENNIWAVGEIYINDSLGNPDPTSYNAVHWNGSSWELIRIGNSGGWSCRALFAFSEINLWFNATTKWNGLNYSVHDHGFPLEPNGDGWLVYKMWGSGDNDLYVVGNNGNIAHYNGSSWTKIQSGTNIEIQDIWGVNNAGSPQRQVFCIASDKYQSIDKKVYSIKNNNVTEISNEGLPWSLSSIWFNNKHKCYIVGDGIFTKDLSSSNSWQNITLGITPYYTHAIRGTGLNDIVVGGSFGELLHFDGSTWYSYKGRELPDFIGNYFAVGIKGNVICAVGQASINSNVAILAIGQR